MRSSSRALTYYEALNLHPNATAAQIKSRFYALSKEYHPDRVLLREENVRADARKRFNAVSEAYSVLGNPDSRHKYDQTIRGRNSNVHNAGTHYYRTPGDQRTGSGLNRTRMRMNYGGDFGKQKQPYNPHPVNPNNVGLGGGYATGMNDDVPHFDFDKHVRQQQAYESFRQLRRNRKYFADATSEEAGNPATAGNPAFSANTESTERYSRPRASNETRHGQASQRNHRFHQRTQQQSAAQQPQHARHSYARTAPQNSPHPQMAESAMSMGKMVGMVCLVSGVVYATMIAAGIL
ncbi:hypothetical protein V1512DRAFT_219493 [Lipomyces arxii]|uniref:uncharacterized protein n=1 Tax=Lipomyces arxii TaxID=56418 RepID=UPI0034CD230D